MARGKAERGVKAERGSKAERGVTVKDVAARCGYAVSTCIDILGGRGGRYSERAREVVQAAALEIGYRPNAVARAMRTGSTGCIALLGSVNPELSVIPGPLLYALDQALTADGKHLAVAGLSDETLTRAGELPHLLAEWYCDGVLVNYQKQVPAAFAKLVDELPLPAVWINNQRPHDCVHPDDRGGIQALVERLVALGHRRIGYADYLVAGMGPGSHYSVEARLTGYREAMAAAGLAPDLGFAPEDVYPGPQGGLARVAAWLAAEQRPSAIITTTTAVAEAGVAIARERGWRLGSDLSLVVVAADNQWILGQELALAQVPIAEVGTRAVAMLAAKQAAPRSRRAPEVVPYTIHPHATLGSPGV